MAKRLLIIGNGISGITAARFARKLDSELEITVISGETEHFFSRTALMYVYMGHMKYEHTKPYEDHFWSKNRINLHHAWVQHVHLDRKEVELDNGQAVGYDKLVLALGSKPNKFGWPGQDLPGVQGLYSYQDLEQLEANTKSIQRGIVIGGGLIGVELAEMLHSRGIEVSILNRDENFWGSVLPKPDAAFILAHIRSQHIDVRINEEMTEILQGDDGRASGVRLKSDGSVLEGQLVGLCAGVRPNIGLVADHSGIETQKGIVVNQFLETSASDVYAIGDCAQFEQNPDPERPPIEQVWYTGRMMGEAVAHTICGKQTAYSPGQWFNSAKFFDIEYQTYGWVRATLPDDEDFFFWQDTSGTKAMHFRWKKDTGKFVGINTFGIRLRHEVFDAWLNQEASIDTVLSELEKAHFDPEMYKKHYAEIHQAYSHQNAFQS